MTVNTQSKIPNIVKSSSRHQFCTKAPSLFLRLLLDLQKIPNYMPNRIFSPKIWQLFYYVNTLIKIQVGLYQNSITASLEKMAAVHRSFFLGCSYLPRILSFILDWKMCFHVTLVIDTKPTVKGELQTVIKNSANS